VSRRQSACEREVKAQPATLGQYHRALDYMLQLANVARPRVPFKRAEVVKGEAEARPLEPDTSAAEEVRREECDVLLAAPEGWHLDGEDGEAVVEVLPEAAGLDITSEIAIGGGNHAHVNLARPDVPHPLEAPILQHTQELPLEPEGDLAHLVEEERAAGGQLESADAIAQRASERALDVTEKLALEEVGGNGSAVHPHERPLAARAPLVDG
jgi:hypothetical protein